MNFENQQRSAKLAQAHSPIKSFSDIVSGGEPNRGSACSAPAPTPLSPVLAQTSTLSSQLSTFSSLLDQLIESTHTVLNGDPRQEACADSRSEPEPSFSCSLEGDLAGLSARLGHHNALLNTVIQRIQL